MNLTPVSQRFFDQGCQTNQWYRWPLVASRRLLRRIQRPFFYSMQSTIDEMKAELNRLSQTVAESTVKQEELTSQVGMLSNRQGIEANQFISIIDDREWQQRTVHSAQNKCSRPLRILFAVSSGSQMYSGIGRAIFESVKQARGQLRYEFAIDDGNARNVELLQQFGREQQIPVHVGRAGNGHGDQGNEALPEILNRGNWDAIECVSFANSATNGAILKHAGHLPIFYTPHFQPMNTIPATPEWAREIERVHGEMLQKAAVIACDNAWEWSSFQSQCHSDVDCALIPLGFSPKEYIVGTSFRRPYLLFVGDLVEKRKRFPLSLKVFEELLKIHPELQLVVVGNRSDKLHSSIPSNLAKHCVLMGYVSEAELHRHYREAMGLLLLSDFEAFGLPILESLASGTPVYLTRRPSVSWPFGKYNGTIFVDDATPEKMAKQIAVGLEKGPDFLVKIAADRQRLENDLSWESHARKRCTAYQAAIAKRNLKQLRMAA